MNLDREIVLTRLLLVFTVLAVAMAYADIGVIGVEYARAGDQVGIAIQIVFALVVAVVVYSYFVYLVSRIGQLQRRREHVSTDREQLEAVYAGEAPALAVLVPSYKEEIAVVRRTLLSAALQEYPRRRVVLLIDDPPQPTDPADAANLAAMRELPHKLRALFDPPAARWERARQLFADRCRDAVFDGRMEAVLLTTVRPASGKRIRKIRPSSRICRSWTPVPTSASRGSSRRPLSTATIHDRQGTGPSSPRCYARVDYWQET